MRILVCRGKETQVPWIRNEDQAEDTANFSLSLCQFVLSHQNLNSTQGDHASEAHMFWEQAASDAYSLRNKILAKEEGGECNDESA